MSAVRARNLEPIYHGAEETNGEPMVNSRVRESTAGCCVVDRCRLLFD
jgi:hypothetical protein